MTKSKKYTSRFSSFIVSPIAIAVTFVGSLLANWGGIEMLAVLLFSLSVAGLTGRLWGFYVLRQVGVQISSTNLTLSVGDTAQLRYTVENNKLLPLTWLELSMDAPDNGCVMPDSGFSLYAAPEGSDSTEPPKPVFRRRILFLMGFRCVSWDVCWSARKRGIFNVSNMSMRSGDGFGLSQSIQNIDTGGSVIIVWPRIVPVDTAPFFRNVWQGGVGKKGHVEDITVLHGLRDYENRDSWKRIDWRMAARSDEVLVRTFENILPSTVHYVLDVESFLGLSADNDELEECISVLASLILELAALGISCGLSLPRGEGFQSVDFSPDDASVDAGDLLNSLAALDVGRASGGFDEHLIESLSQSVGQLWMVSYSGERLSCVGLAERLAAGCFFTLCYNTERQGILAGYPMISLRSLKR